MALSTVQVHALSGGRFTLPETQFVSPASSTARKTVPSLCFLIQHASPTTGKMTRIVFDLGVRRDPSRYSEPIRRHITTRQPLTTDPDVVKSLKMGGLTPDDVDYVIYSHVTTPCTRFPWAKCLSDFETRFTGITSASRPTFAAAPSSLGMDLLTCYREMHQVYVEVIPFSNQICLIRIELYSFQIQRRPTQHGMKRRYPASTLAGRGASLTAYPQPWISLGMEVFTSSMPPVTFPDTSTFLHAPARMRVTPNGSTLPAMPATIAASCVTKERSDSGRMPKAIHVVSMLISRKPRLRWRGLGTWKEKVLRLSLRMMWSGKSGTRIAIVFGGVDPQAGFLEDLVETFPLQIQRSRI